MCMLIRPNASLALCIDHRETSRGNIYRLGIVWKNVTECGQPFASREHTAAYEIQVHLSQPKIQSFVFVTCFLMSGWRCRFIIDI